MNQLFRHKLESIHANLVARHKETQNYSSSITGAEREIVIKELLSLILPSNNRIGSGTIIDAFGKETGQIDAVIEQPFSLSFPVASESNRLYLAETVVAAFEIKSNLDSQKEDALKKIKEIKCLRRYKSKNKREIQLLDHLQIPCFIIGYAGPAKIDTLENNFINPTDSSYPDGVLAIESELFYGRQAGGNWYMATGKAECIFAFLSCLINSINIVSHNEIGTKEYIELLTKS